MSASGEKHNIEDHLQAQVLAANDERRRLNIIGGASKSFYGREAGGTAIHTAAHNGVVHYDPAELVVTLRAGTLVGELDELLRSKQQMPGFEPPRFSAATTIGGAVAAGLAGPRRPYSGAVRDFVLGVRMLNGKGEILRFGGEVMKNVAGFDIARLMAGAMGTLGILLEVSLRVVPLPAREMTVVLEQADAGEAIALFTRLAGRVDGRTVPLSAAAWLDGETRLRLSGSIAGVESAVADIGGEVDSGGDRFWQQLRDHELPFFGGGRPLLRVSVPPATELGVAGLGAGELGAGESGAAQLVDWGGAQRWIAGEVDIDSLRTRVARHGGHVTQFRNADRQGAIFQPLEPVVHALHLRLKRAFDPAGILNHGRLYRDF